MAFKVGDHYERPINPGEYIVEIINLTQDVSAKKRTQQYDLTLRIVGSAFADRTLRHSVYITEKALKMVAQFMVHFGVDVQTEFDIYDADETWNVIKGKRAKAKVFVENYSGVDFSKVESFKVLTASEMNAAKSIVNEAPAKRDSTKDFVNRDKPAKPDSADADDTNEGLPATRRTFETDGDIPF